MELVMPIKDKGKIDEMKQELLKQSYRDYMIFVFGCNCGLRISDIIDLKVSDVKNRRYIELREQKTNKNKMFPISGQFKVEIDKYIQGMDDTDYLFTSRQACKDGTKKNITRVQAYRALKQVADRLKIEHFGLHSMRKSFGFFYYEATGDLVKLMDMFNHSSLAITKRYIGITQDELDESLEGFFI